MKKHGPSQHLAATKKFTAAVLDVGRRPQLQQPVAQQLAVHIVEQYFPANSYVFNEEWQKPNVAEQPYIAKVFTVLLQM